MTLVSFARNNIRPWELDRLLYDEFVTLRVGFQSGGVMS